MRSPCRYLLAISAMASVPTAAQQRPLSLDDLGELVAVRAPVLSPDGQRIVYSTSRPDFDANRTVTTVWQLDLSTRTAHPILTDRAGVRDVVWSGATTLAFAARPDSSSSSQVFVADVSSGRSRQVTTAPSGVRAFAIAPDGATVAYTTDDVPAERTGSERFNDSFEIGNDDFLTMAAPQPVHLWTQAVAGGAPRRLTSGPWSLATSLSTSPVQWLPDASALIVQQFASPHSGDTDKSRVIRVGIANGAVTPVTAERERASGPVVSPDGQWVAYQSPRDGGAANLRDLHLVATAGGAARNVSRALDRPVSADWLPGGEMLWSGNDGTRVSLWRARPDGHATRLSLGAVVAVSSPSIASDGSFVFLGAERGRPDEVYRWPTGAAAPERLTNHNDFLSTRATAQTVGIEWRTPDGFTTDGVVTYPSGFDKSRTYPLVLFIHGGPTAASNEAFSARVQLLAAEGWIVFQPNYRGSDNRGSAFQRAIADNPGPGIDRDVMSGIRALVRRGGVDTTRIGVSGWSFGGYVTAWLIGHHRHWKAALVGAGAMDLFDMYALTDLNVQIRHAITASPYVGKREAWFQQQSPLTYASQVRTPTLILHDVRDQRVTITQSFKLYHALKDNGVPVQFIAYPIAGHGPTDPVRSRDVHRRWLEWFRKEFGRAAEAGVSSGEEYHAK